MADGEPSSNFPVGCELHLETSLGEEIVGEVCAFDKQSNVLVLRQQGSSPSVSNIIVLRANFVKAVKSAKWPTEPVEPLPEPDVKKGHERRLKATQAAKAEWEKIGVGVTPEAQLIFDALNKTLPCVWDQKKILVMQEVIIDEPYSTDMCRAINAAADEALLDRVKTVLDQERARLGYK